MIFFQTLHLKLLTSECLFISCKLNLPWDFFFHLDTATSGLRVSVCTCEKPNLAWQNHVGDVKPCNDWPQARKLIAEECLL